MITTREEQRTTTGRTAARYDVLDSFERVLWWLFAGSVGGRTRSAVLSAIREKPRNAQQLAQRLGLDYTTIRHHLRVLQANNLVIAEGDKYGRVYFVSEAMESQWDKLESINKRRLRSKGKAER